MSIRDWMKKRIQELPTGEYVCKVTTLDNISAFDVLEPVVRCKDCKYFDQEGWTDGITGDCMNFYEVYDYDFCQFTTTIDGFCAWGERKVVDYD